MSRGFVKDGDQEDVPVVTPRAFLPEGMTNYVTPEGLAALEREKDALLAERDGVTGNETDRRITYNYLNAKLSLLDARISSAVLRRAEELPEGTVGFGTYFKLLVEKSGTCRTFRITGADEADSKKGFISFFSPLARAVTGHRLDESFEVDLPGGRHRVRITAVSCSSCIMPEAVRERYVMPLKGNPSSGGVSVEHGGPGRAPGTSGPEGRPETEASGASAAGVRKSVPEALMAGGKDVSVTPSGSAAGTVRKDDQEEVFPIVNERGVTIGRAFRWQCHDGSKLLHPVVHLHLFNSRGELYLQKRPLWKDIQPGRWDTAVGGHVGFGEKPEAALLREAQEELGISGFSPVFIRRYVFESAREKELVHVYQTVYDGPVVPSSELDGGRFWTREEVETSIGRKVFTPNFESEWRKYMAGSFRK